jgi:hypothetical protein
MTWVLVLWCVIVVSLAVITDLQSKHTSHQCMRECRRLLGGLSTNSAEATLLIGVVGLVILSVIWFLTLGDDSSSPAPPGPTS